MATSLTITAASAKVQWEFTNEHAWGNSTNASSYSYSKRLTNGTAINNADKIYISSSTLAGGASVNLDLAGTLADMFGNTITFARIKVIYVELTTDTTSTGLLVGGHATAAFGNWITSADTLDNDQPKVRVRNGGCFFLCAPDATAYAVTATTDDLLTLTNADGSNTATYKVVLVGASA